MLWSMEAHKPGTTAASAAQAAGAATNMVAKLNIPAIQIRMSLSRK
jgi:hypothetical protein